jgi:sulfur-carrier protein
MELKIRFFTTLREIANKRDETLNFTNSKTATITVILKELSQKYGSSFTEYVYDPETREPRSFLQLLVNGTSAPDGLETELKDGDVLAILPPVGGG